MKVLKKLRFTVRLYTTPSPNTLKMRKISILRAFHGPVNARWTALYGANHASLIITQTWQQCSAMHNLYNVQVQLLEMPTPQKSEKLKVALLLTGCDSPRPRSPRTSSPDANPSQTYCDMPLHAAAPPPLLCSVGANIWHSRRQHARCHDPSPLVPMSAPRPIGPSSHA